MTGDEFPFSPLECIIFVAEAKFVPARPLSDAKSSVHAKRLFISVLSPSANATAQRETAGFCSPWQNQFRPSEPRRLRFRVDVLAKHINPGIGFDEAFSKILVLGEEMIFFHLRRGF